MEIQLRKGTTAFSIPALATFRQSNEYGVNTEVPLLLELQNSTNNVDIANVVRVIHYEAPVQGREK